MRTLLRTTTEPPDNHSSDKPIVFHRRLPGYTETPLIEASKIAKMLGVSTVFVKDETSRFSLPSFKVLGASWATYFMLQKQLDPIPDGPLSFKMLQEWAAPLRPLTLLAATDGNHGRAVARVAKWFGLNAKIFIPDFVSSSRRQAIESEGAKVITIDGVYDASVDAALEASTEENTLLISDTARSASDLIPQLVTAGYTTAFDEVDQQLSRLDNDHVDAVSIQAGVGGLATACTSWSRVTRHGRSPHVMVVEPESAACVMTALAAGEPTAVSACEISSMCVLQCGTVSFTAFAPLQAGVSCCLAIEDSWATSALTELSKCGVNTGLSGAAGTAGLMAGLKGPLANSVREHLNLSRNSRVLVVATESMTASGHA